MTNTPIYIASKKGSVSIIIVSFGTFLLWWLFGPEWSMWIPPPPPRCCCCHTASGDSRSLLLWERPCFVWNRSFRFVLFHPFLVTLFSDTYRTIPTIHYSSSSSSSSSESPTPKSMDGLCRSFFLVWEDDDFDLDDDDDARGCNPDALGNAASSSSSSARLWFVLLLLLLFDGCWCIVVVAAASQSSNHSECTSIASFKWWMVIW